MADSVAGRTSVSAAADTILSPRHSALVRVTHWLITLSFLALLLSGVEILISHPRFYWGETGNVGTRPLFTLPIPASPSPPATATCFPTRTAGAAISIFNLPGSRYVPAYFT